MTFDVKSAARRRQSSDRWMISCNAIHTVTPVKYLWREFGQPIQSISRVKDGDINERIGWLESRNSNPMQKLRWIWFLHFRRSLQKQAWMWSFKHESAFVKDCQSFGSHERIKGLCLWITCGRHSQSALKLSTYLLLTWHACYRLALQASACTRGARCGDLRLWESYAY